MIRFTVDIFCAVCGTWMHCGIDISATTARTIATKAGWRVSTKYGDLCPKCASEKKS